MAVALKEKLLEALRAQGGIDEAKLKLALKLQEKQGRGLGRILVEQGFLTQKELMLVLSRHLDIPPINLTRYKLEPSLMQILPENFIREYKIIPLSKIGEALTVALCDPLDLFVLDRLKALTWYRLEMVLATEDDIKTALDNYYSGRGADIKKAIDKADEAEVGILEPSQEEYADIGGIADKVNLPPIIKIVNLILIEALNRRSSDIHIEPAEKSLKIRYRIDGILHDILNLPKKTQNAIIARIKILSKLDITQTHLPQDGRFKIRVSQREVDFRVSVLPTLFGGKVVLRLLDKGSIGAGLERLGFLNESIEAFKKALEKPYGMVLVTGPTGSGKSTTLYSILNGLNTSERNIITLEDPVEYQLEGITQIQARPEIGLSFAAGLRSLLRQNPDVIMVGEIRDSETADIAIKASLTGTMVFSTLHTNDAASSITRLIDMGVEPFLIASSIVFICAQRLVRKICPDCVESYEIPKAVFDRQGIDYDYVKRSAKDKKFYRGKGCERCGNTGFFGRMGIMEALLIDDNIRDMIAKKTPASAIKAYAVKQGMKTLRDDAIEKFLNGLTALEEVISVTSEE